MGFYLFSIILQRIGAGAYRRAVEAQRQEEQRRRDDDDRLPERSDASSEESTAAGRHGGAMVCFVFFCFGFSQVAGVDGDDALVSINDGDNTPTGHDNRPSWKKAPLGRQSIRKGLVNPIIMSRKSIIITIVIRQHQSD